MAVTHRTLLGGLTLSCGSTGIVAVWSGHKRGNYALDCRVAVLECSKAKLIRPPQSYGHGRRACMIPISGNSDTSWSELVWRRVVDTKAEGRPRCPSSIAENCFAAGSQLNQPSMHKCKAGEGSFCALWRHYSSTVQNSFPLLGLQTAIYAPNPFASPSEASSCILIQG